MVSYKIFMLYLGLEFVLFHLKMCAIGEINDSLKWSIGIVFLDVYTSIVNYVYR